MRIFGATKIWLSFAVVFLLSWITIEAGSKSLDASGSFVCSDTAVRLDEDAVVVFGSSTDSYPSKLKGRGRVVAITPGGCGAFACSMGTIAVEVSKASRRYPSKLLFAVVGCIPESSVDVFCGKSVRFRAQKLMPTTIRGCSLWNDIDSAGVPFYYIDRRSRIEVLKGDNGG